MATIEDKVAADIAALEEGAATVAHTVERYQHAKANTAGAAIITPMVALATAANREDGIAQLTLVAERLEGEDVEDITELVRLATLLANKLAVSLATLDVTAWVTACERLVGLAASPYQLVEDDVMVAAGVAVTAWKAAFTSYQQASGANIQRNIGRGPRGRGGRGGSRGPGKWLEDHGWYFTGECLSCGHVVTSASNVGSFSHEMAKHWPTCRGENGGPLRDAAGNRVERIYAGDPEMDAISAAMYAVADGAMEATAEGSYIIRHVDAASQVA